MTALGNGVNALNGLLLISSTNDYKNDLSYICVNALNGLLLISSELCLYEPENDECVNALNGLLLISSTNDQS